MMSNRNIILLQLLSGRVIDEENRIQLFLIMLMGGPCPVGCLAFA
jgi:hypothetical protein